MSKKNIMIIISFSIIVFAVISIGILQLIDGNKYNPTKYEECTKNIISYEEVLSQKENTYYVLVHRKDCSGCKKIESAVCEYICEDSSNKLYLLSSDTCRDKIVEFDSNNEAINNICVSDINELRIASVPILLVIEEKTIVSFFVGAKEILNKITL